MKEQFTKKKDWQGIENTINFLITEHEYTDGLVNDRNYKQLVKIAILKFCKVILKM